MASSANFSVAGVWQSVMPSWAKDDIEAIVVMKTVSNNLFMVVSFIEKHQEL
jgi:hypothetical protein